MSNMPVTAGGEITSPLHGVSVTNPTTTMTQANSSFGKFTVGIKKVKHLNKFGINLITIWYRNT